MKFTITQRFVFLVILTAIGIKARASVYHCSGKEVTKGQAIVTLATNSNAKCTKTDEIEFNSEKGTLKNKAKAK